MKTNNVTSEKKYDNWDDVFSDSRPMAFKSFNTGTISSTLKPYIQNESLPSGFDLLKTLNFAVMAFYFKHPENGDILIDSGFDRSFYENPGIGNLSSAVRDYLEANGARYTQKKDEDLMSHLKKHGINPSHAFLTHMHPDHTAGIPVLAPDCKIYYGKVEDSPEYQLFSGNHLEGKKSIHLLDADSGVAIAPFDRVIDVFEDGTFWALSTPGHTRDHFAYLINAAPTPMLIVGDAELTKWGMEHCVFMNTDHGEKGERAVQDSAGTIRRFHAMYPQVTIWFSHDEHPLTT